MSNSDPSGQPTRTRPHPLDGSAESTLARISTAPSLSPGSTFGPYRIIRLLGKGGMGEAYEAEQMETGRRLALKVLADPDPSPQARERFLREGRLAASINHPNSVYVFGTEEIEDRWAIAMELVGGGTLKDRIRERGPLPAREVADTILQVIDGLEAAASVGILHRDIKPANCFLELDGTAKIGDFGLSLSTLARDRSRHQLTGSGTFLGTPAFASPEQLRGADIDVRSDIYSLGATMYYLLVGRPPFENENLMQLLTTIASSEPEAPHRLRPEVSRSLSNLVLQCLAKSAENRPRDYAELRGRLQEFATPRGAPREDLVFGAALIDTAALGVVAAVMGSWGGMAGFFTHPLGGWLALAFLLISLPMTRGAGSVGDRLLGLRIANRLGEPISKGRTLLDALVAGLCAGLTYSNMSPALLFDSPRKLFFTIMSGASLRFLAVRPLGVRRVSFKGRSATAAAVAQPNAEPQEGIVIGPYRVASGPSQDGLCLGYDPILNRNVWIHSRSAGAPVDSTRRDLRRAARLRWINGGRSERGFWDAYEAPFGSSLSLRSQPMDWSKAREVVLELARELSAGRADGTLPPSLGLDRVWLDETGRGKLLETLPPRTAPEDRTYASLDDRECLRFLGRVMERLAADPAGPMLLPRNARCFLSEVESGSLRSLHDALPILTVLARGEVAPPYTKGGMEAVAPLFAIGFTPLYLALKPSRLPDGLTILSSAAIFFSIGAFVYLLALLLRFGLSALTPASGLWPARTLSFSSLHEVVGADGLPARQRRALLRSLVVIVPICGLGFAAVWFDSPAPLALIGLGMIAFSWFSWAGRDVLGSLTRTRLVPTHRPFGFLASDRSADYEVLRDILSRPEFKDFDGRDEAAWARLKAAALKKGKSGVEP